MTSTYGKTFLLGFCVAAALCAVSGCESYRTAYADVSLENEIERLGYIAASAAPSLAPGSIVALEHDARKGDFGLVCSWNQILSQPPEVQAAPPSRSLERGLLNRYARPPFVSGTQADYLLENVQVSKLQSLNVPLAAIIAGSTDVSCEVAIEQVRRRPSKLFAVVQSLRAELVYTLRPINPDDVSLIARQLTSSRTDDSIDVSLQGARVIVTSRVQLGIRVLEY
jgi:hypothetical protein